MPYDSIAIVGVGLIGGSVGLAARRRGVAREVVGIGRRTESLQVAANLGAITRATTNLAEGVRDAELVMVCTPVDDVVTHVRQAAAANQRSALISDAGSTKERIVEELERTLPRDVRFIGGHPMAGSHASGPAQADGDLFVGRTVIITPTERTSPDDAAAITAFWSALGARVVSLSPPEHDRAVAAVSHVPHLVAATLIQSISSDDLPLAAGGLRDATRIALGDPELWRQIVLSNRSHIAAGLERFQLAAQKLRDVLESESGDELLAMLTNARQIRQTLKENA